MPQPINVSELLKQAGLRPQKSLGQNFLSDERVLARIANAAELTDQDTVLEIGPGLGGLTRHLAERARQVIAVELDAALIPILHQTLAPYPNVQIVHGDILQIANRKPQIAISAVVGNIPYNLTAQIFRRLLETSPRPRVIVLTVQLEVAQRITARPGDMSLLALSVQFYGHPSIAGRIKAGAFYPPPKVDSAIVRIETYAQPPVEVADVERFFAVARAGFSQRRKQLHNALAGGLACSQDRVAAALERAGLDGRRRAETLSLAEWASLARELG
ncbi:MAG: 16S rRNA (adenine(1518)-N(6)/adenine(1519)-N(6))-dimethyltransferase RsmA [Thermoflexales bacterium]|nr:16S rRNA (adenine(1518)-N(6)/adenine(1519)-N(6))-dimethyltransferase RsmA [Thermoflexales bacterium]